jgi:hypothetical protein
MLIRSQDKKVIINIDNVSQVRTGGMADQRIIVFADDQVIVLGEYSTEEKAIKVLDMIQDAYTRTTKMCISDAEISFHQMAVVFQMPQDSEV